MSIPDMPSLRQESASNPYDKVSYHTSPYTRSHPRWLAAVAHLFGIPTQDPRNARILELGCGNGMNLIPIAAALPHAELCGLDLSEKAIELAYKTSQELGLRNLTLQVADILNPSIIAGRFDYIIAHGLFSWVPHDVQERLLEILGDHLTENGIAFISYNTFPGWRIRGIARDAAQLVTQSCSSEEEAARKAREWYGVLATSLRTEDGDNTLLLTQELQRQMHLPDWYLLHDTLEEDNHPIYFSDFMHRATRYKLRFLSEADISKSLPHEFPASVSAFLQRHWNDQIAYEQMLDFLRLRMLRCTLLCRQTVNVPRSPQSGALNEMYIGCNLKSPIGPEALGDDQRVTFKNPVSGAAIQTHDSLLKRVIHYLGTIWPEFKRVDQLPAQLSDKPYGVDCDRLRGLIPALWQLVVTGLAEVTTYPLPITASVPRRPRAFAAARVLASNSTSAPNLRHENISLNPLQRSVLVLCDGTHTLDHIATTLERSLEETVGLCRSLAELAFLENEVQIEE